MFNITSNGVNRQNLNPAMPSEPISFDPQICRSGPIITSDTRQLTNSNYSIDELRRMIPLGTELTSRVNMPFPTPYPSALESTSEEFIIRWCNVLLDNGAYFLIYIYDLSNWGVSGFVKNNGVFISIFAPISWIKVIARLF